MSSRRPTVLLVEDNFTLQNALAGCLARWGFRVVSFDCGREAFTWLNEHIPDLAILDMMLPKVSGFTLARTIKDRTAERAPVIMISANTSLAHRHYAFASGADRFLTKPFTLADLEETIRQLHETDARGTSAHRSLLASA